MSVEKKLLEEIRRMYAELRLSSEAMEKDLEKNLSKKNVAAGRRARTSLRNLKTKATELIRSLVSLDKERK